MALAKTNILIKVGKKHRRLISIFENKKDGTVTIRPFSGTQYGLSADNPKVIQHKYSIHSSLESETHNTFKRTMVLENGETTHSYNFTNAIKSKTGFTPVFHIRYSDLNASIYDIDKSDSSIAKRIGAYSPAEYTLILGVYVGDKNSYFPKTSDSAIITSLQSTHFKIVIAHFFINLPSIPYAWIIEKITFDARDIENEESRKQIEAHTNSLTVDQCLEYMNMAASSLTKNQLEVFRHLAPTEEAKLEFEKLIDQIQMQPHIRI